MAGGVGLASCCVVRSRSVVDDIHTVHAYVRYIAYIQTYNQLCTHMSCHAMSLVDNRTSDRIKPLGVAVVGSFPVHLVAGWVPSHGVKW